MIVKINGIQRKLAWVGTSPKYSLLKMRPEPPLETAALPQFTNNEAAIAAIINQWIEDQGTEGACASFAAIYLMRWLQAKLGLPIVDLSKQYLYREVRKREHTWPWDSGSTMTDVAWVAHKYGICRESLWPYVASEYDKNPPSPECDKDAPNHRVLDSFAIPNAQTALSQLARRGPFMCGITICPNFPGIADDSGNVETPDDGTGVILTPKGEALGGHGVMVMDYSQVPRTYVRGGKSVTVPYPHLVFPNSWNVNRYDAQGNLLTHDDGQGNQIPYGWGHAGWGYLPMTFMTGSAGGSPLMSEMIEFLKELDVA